MPFARVRPGIVDASIAAVLFGVGLLELVGTGDDGSPGARLLAVGLTTIPLAWRSIAPVTTVAITVGGFLVACLVGGGPSDQFVPTLAPMVAVYSVGASSPPWGIAVGGAIALGGYLAAGTATDGDAEDLAYTITGVTLALLAGAAVRVMGFESDALEARAAELEHERDEKAAAAVVAERARIARELHDVIGQSISVMGLQAGAVRRLLDPSQEEERRALLGIERLSRDSVAEMHGLLGFLRDGDDDGGASAPPSLDRVRDLVADMRGAGVDVELDVDDELRFDELSQGRALAVFRILQEALTNALKHAPGAHVRASLRRTPRGVEIDVVDDGPGVVETHVNGGGGHGLVGMRERVALYDGTLDAGPRADRGFAVRAQLPTGAS